MSEKDDFEIDIPVNLLTDYEEIEKKINSLFKRSADDSFRNMQNVISEIDKQFREFQSINISKMVEDISKQDLQFTIETDELLERLNEMISYNWDDMKGTEGMQEVLEEINDLVIKYRHIIDILTELQSEFTDIDDIVMNALREVLDSDDITFKKVYNTYRSHYDSVDEDFIEEKFNHIRGYIEEIIDIVNDIDNNMDRMQYDIYSTRTLSSSIYENTQSIIETLEENKEDTAETLDVIFSGKRSTRLPTTKVDMGRMGEDLDMLLEEFQSSLDETRLSQRDLKNFSSELDQIEGLIADLQTSALQNIEFLLDTNRGRVPSFDKIIESLTDHFDAIMSTVMNRFDNMYERIIREIQNLDTIESIEAQIGGSMENIDVVEGESSPKFGQFLGNLLSYYRDLEEKRNTETSDIQLIKEKDEELHTMMGELQEMIQEVINNQLDTGDEVETVRNSDLSDLLSNIDSMIRRIQTYLGA